MTRRDVIERELMIADIKMHALAACRLGEGRAVARSGAVADAGKQGLGFFCSEMVMPVNTMRRAISLANKEMGDD